jgi:epoxide hydrolase-like predicted phosphatase
MINTIDTLIFDLGGVLISNDDEGIVTNSEETQKYLNKSEKELDNAWSIAWPRFRNGNITEDEFYSIFLKTLNIKDENEKINMLKNIYRENVNLLESFSLLKKLSSKYNLYALTNIGKEGLKYKVKRFSLDDYFIGIVASSMEGIEKPEEEIFNRLINKYVINPQTSIFIDDLERNIKVAKKFGFLTILYTNKEQMINNLKQFGIEI